VDDCDRQMFREHLDIRHNWDKVILLNPLDHRSAFEIRQTPATSLQRALR
jgi:hypothetical protein